MNNDLKTIAFRIRRIILDASKRANVGHIGSALSVADIVAVLFAKSLCMPGTDDPNRDRFIMSKGHAALALYAALHLNGIVGYEALLTYCQDGSRLGVHPEHHLAGIDFSTGSLGHGLSFGAGVALAARLSGAKYRSFVLVSDAECNEGSLWETVMFSAHHKLSSLVAIIDDNGQQALGKTRDILDINPIGDKWRAFGWNVHEIDGHDVRMIEATLRGLDTESGLPNVIVANTVCGKGVSFMEDKVEWHYLPMTQEQYVKALEEVEENAT
ncbi:MAG: transketolase [Deltaproteobacteria bacterium]|nr:transketolase [Deltaproteobacteria bacterium]